MNISGPGDVVFTIIAVISIGIAKSISATVAPKISTARFNTILYEELSGTWRTWITGIPSKSSV